jgi:hypothetical protein
MPTARPIRKFIRNIRRNRGSATTIYDEHDRATEVQVRDANGELVNRALRTYDAQGRVVEEKRILDNPETIIPSGVRAKILEQSDLPADQLRQELRTQITMLMAGQPGAYSVSYICDTRDRINQTSRRIFNRELIQLLPPCLPIPKFAIPTSMISTKIGQRKQFHIAPVPTPHSRHQP